MEIPAPRRPRRWSSACSGARVRVALVGVIVVVAVYAFVYTLLRATDVFPLAEWQSDRMERHAQVVFPGMYTFFGMPDPYDRPARGTMLSLAWDLYEPLRDAEQSARFWWDN